MQEALTNTLKQAGPVASAEVQFTWGPDALSVTVRDRCPDRRPDRRPAEGSGHGLIGMRERLAAVGGSVAAGPAGSDGGFLMTARLPYQAGLPRDGESA